MKERFDKSSFGRTTDVTKQALVGPNRFPPRLEWLSFPKEGKLITLKSAESPGSGREGVTGASVFFLSEAG